MSGCFARRVVLLARRRPRSPSGRSKESSLNDLAYLDLKMYICVSAYRRLPCPTSPRCSSPATSSSSDCRCSFISRAMRSSWRGKVTPLFYAPSGRPPQLGHLSELLSRAASAPTSQPRNRRKARKMKRELRETKHHRGQIDRRAPIGGLVELKQCEHPKGDDLPISRICLFGVFG